MSSLFHEAESQLARLGLGVLDRGELDVVVGGSGRRARRADLDLGEVHPEVAARWLLGLVDEAAMEEMMTFKNDLYRASLATLEPGDVLPGARELLADFGSLRAVLDAPSLEGAREAIARSVAGQTSNFLVGSADGGGRLQKIATRGWCWIK